MNKSELELAAITAIRSANFQERQNAENMLTRLMTSAQSLQVIINYLHTCNEYEVWFAIAQIFRKITLSFNDENSNLTEYCYNEKMQILLLLFNRATLTQDMPNYLLNTITDLIGLMVQNIIKLEEQKSIGLIMSIMDPLLV